MKRLFATGVLALLTACSAPNESAAPTSEHPGPSIEAAPPERLSQTPAEPVSNWSYNQQIDEMRGTTTRFAQLVSTNSVGVQSPYTPGPATLYLRRRATDGTSVFIGIEGQFTCFPYSGERVAVKFDDGPIEHFGCSEPDDGTSGVLFINSPERFISRMKTADKMIVEVPIYEAGDQQLTFVVKGLKWD